MIDKILNITCPKLNAVDGDESYYDDIEDKSPQIEWNSEDGGYKQYN